MENDLNLENFNIPGAYQVNVYDKQLGSSRINSINDIASENYFYDIEFSNVLNEDIIKEVNRRNGKKKSTNF